MERCVSLHFIQQEHVHKGTIETVYSLLDGEYEFIEAEILEKSELLNNQ